METDLFEGVYIQDTWVLAWEATPQALVFDVDASLWPANPHYESPKPGEWTCYKHAQLRFLAPYRVEGLKLMASVKPYTDLDGSLDYSTIDAFMSLGHNQFQLSGSFGDVHIDAAAIEFVICE